MGSSRRRKRSSGPGGQPYTRMVDIEDHAADFVQVRRGGYAVMQSRARAQYPGSDQWIDLLLAESRAAAFQKATDRQQLSIKY